MDKPAYNLYLSIKFLHTAYKTKDKHLFYYDIFIGMEQYLMHFKVHFKQYSTRKIQFSNRQYSVVVSDRNNNRTIWLLIVTAFETEFTKLTCRSDRFWDRSETSPETSVAMHTKIQKHFSDGITDQPGLEVSDQNMEVVRPVLYKIILKLATKFIFLKKLRS